MNRVAANQLIIEIIINLVTGDKASARQAAERLDEEGLRRLKLAGEEVAILAETVFFEKRREKRTDKSKGD